MYHTSLKDFDPVFIKSVKKVLWYSSWGVLYSSFQFFSFNFYSVCIILVMHQKSVLTFLEYRRLLLNAVESQEHEDVANARQYIKYLEQQFQMQESPSKNLDHKPKLRKIIHVESYENDTVLGALMRDSYLNSSHCAWSSFIGICAGIFAYVKVYRPMQITSPKNQLMYVYWKHRGIRHNRYLFGLFKEPTYTIAQPNESLFVLQPFGALERSFKEFGVSDWYNKVVYLSLDPIPYDFNFELVSKNGKKFYVKGKVDLRIDEIKPDEKEKKKWVLKENRIRLLGLTQHQIIERVNNVLKFGLHETMKEIESELIESDPNAFFIYIQQTMGFYLRYGIGLAVFRAHGVRIFDEDGEMQVGDI